MITRTKINIAKSNHTIDHNTSSFFIGSCFSENIGQLLKEEKFPTLINPFGVLYNPVSIKNSLEILLTQKPFKESDLIKNNNLWVSFNHHSSFSSIYKNQCLDKINQSFIHARSFLKHTNYLFITFGTARIYKLKTNGKVVSNCHKFPADHFERSLLSIEEIVADYQVLLESIKRHVPDIQVIFTLSPVRHLKDGFVENMESKSILHTSIQEITKKYNYCHYFPAYEIMMDDLRDYRYYAEDMIHPGYLGIQYIYEKFAEIYFNEHTKNAIKLIRKLKKSINHRPLTDDKETILNFLSKEISKAEKMEHQYLIDLSPEKNALKEKITLLNEQK